mmetsp:Transcript_47913/g.113854  ORF Transcript_47913/g.113854 Transcript_47913/m.113854 type:complete len:321 (-) Transcript_47913:45-1007(-)
MTRQNSPRSPFELRNARYAWQMMMSSGVELLCSFWCHSSIQQPLRFLISNCRMITRIWSRIAWPSSPLLPRGTALSIMRSSSASTPRAWAHLEVMSIDSLSASCESRVGLVLCLRCHASCRICEKRSHTITALSRDRSPAASLRTVRAALNRSIRDSPPRDSNAAMLSTPIPAPASDRESCSRGVSLGSSSSSLTRAKKSPSGALNHLLSDAWRSTKSTPSAFPSILMLATWPLSPLTKSVWTAFSLRLEFGPIISSEGFPHFLPCSRAPQCIASGGRSPPITRTSSILPASSREARRRTCFPSRLNRTSAATMCSSGGS